MTRIASTRERVQLTWLVLPRREHEVMLHSVAASLSTGSSPGLARSRDFSIRVRSRDVLPLGAVLGGAWPSRAQEVGAQV
jgi:hypothetical protein